MEIHQLRYFQAVARHGHFSRAAKACHVSQPSLSQQLRKLEDELGHPLFRRTRRGAVLTDWGERLLPRAQAVLNELGAIRAEAGEGGALQELSVGAIPTIAPYLLPVLIARGLRASPGLQFRVSEETTDVLLQSLREGRLDLGLASPPFPGARDMAVEVLMEDELLVTLPRRHPLCRRPAVTVAEAMEHPLVLMKEAHCLSRQTMEVCGRARNDPRVSLDHSQLDTVLAMVEAGLGLSFTPRLALPAMKHRRVAFRSLAPQPMTRQIALVYPKAHPLSTTAAAFRTICHALGEAKGTDWKYSC